MNKKNKILILFFSFLLYLFTIFIYGYYEYLKDRKDIYIQIDEKLRTSAIGTSLILGEGYFDKASKFDSISPKEDMENIKKLTTFANSTNVMYVYSLIEKDNKVYFTTSSATKEELKSSKNLTRYFDEYTDLSEELKNSFKDKKIHFSEYTDKWGTFRTIFIPMFTKNGTFYVVASDIKMDEINSLLKENSLGHIFKISILTLFGLALFLWQMILSNKKLSIHNKSLEHDKEILLSLFDNSNSVLFKLKNDENLSIEYVSNSVEKLLGYKRSDLMDLNKSYWDLVDKNDIEKIKNELLEQINSNSSYFKHLPYHIKTLNNSHKCVLDETVIIRNKNGEIVNFLVYILDITEQKERERIFFEQNKLASMGEMIGNIAHQWRQPLSVISSIASGISLLKECGKLDNHDLDKDLRLILEQINYLSKTIDDFRNFLKNDKQKESICVKNILEKTNTIVSPVLQDEHINLILKVDNSAKIECFSNELLQCFMNIINNSKDAIKENIPTSQKRFIFISTQKNENFIDVLIQDNGGGIPLDVISRIFEPYFTTKHQSIGTGLGLSMTYKILKEHHNANIVVTNEKFVYENSEYFGACFRISFKYYE